MRWKSYPKKKKMRLNKHRKNILQVQNIICFIPLTDTSIEIHPQQFKNDDEH